VHQESAHGLRDAAVSMSTVVTVDDGGSIFFWNLLGKEDGPRATINFPGLSDFYVRPDGDMYLLSSSAMALLSCTTGTVIASRVIHNYSSTTYGLSTDGIVLIVRRTTSKHVAYNATSAYFVSMIST